MVFGKSFLSMMGAIAATGIVLNMAGSGMFGTQVKSLAQYITKGYGV
jgi:hypothetical protein